jgi:hypothetical protein
VVDDDAGGVVGEFAEDVEDAGGAFFLADLGRVVGGVDEDGQGVALAISSWRWKTSSSLGVMRLKPISPTQTQRGWSR